MYYLRLYIFAIISMLCFLRVSYSRELPEIWSKPENLTVLNTNKDDFAPSWNPLEKKLYFCSDISGNSTLYWAQQISTFTFSKPIAMKGLLNSEKSHRAYFSFAPDGNVYLAAYRKTGKYPKMNIAFSTVQRNAWSEPHFIEQLASAHFDSHPAISPNGSVMVFSSNRLTGKTTDLFMSIKQQNGIWGEPIELSEINSNGNEVTPFFFSDSLLFFASDGLSGIGGFDIYKAEFYDGLLRRPTPLNEINTEYDESDFIVLPNGAAIFASNRPGGSGGLDLYISYPISNTMPEEIISNIELSLMASPAEIRIHEDIKYLNILMQNNVNIYDDIFNSSNNIYYKNDCIEFDFLNLNPANYLLNLIFEKSKVTNSEITITLSNFSDAESSEAFVGKIKHFANSLDYQSNQINFILSDKVEKDFFTIAESHNSPLFLSKTSVRLAFEEIMLDISAKADDNHFRSYQLEFYNSAFQKSEDKIDNSHFPISRRVNLNSFKEWIARDSELNISLSLFSGSEISNQTGLSIPVYSSISKEPFSTIIKGKKYFVYALSISPSIDNYESFFKINSEQLSMIRENFKIAKSLKIASNNQVAENAIAFIKQFASNSSPEIKVDKSSVNVVNYELPENIFVLVEIK